jgi:hypothetical protein
MRTLADIDAAIKRASCSSNYVVLKRGVVADLRAMLGAERERCAKIAEDHAHPNRFSVHDCWREQSPSEVYDTAAQDVGGWIAEAIREPV